MAEPLGVDVICQNCEGTGYIERKMFKERKIRSDINEVHRSKGKFIFGPVGPEDNFVTYEEFCKGKMP